jgi:hypothetical protein
MSTAEDESKVPWSLAAALLTQVAGHRKIVATAERSLKNLSTRWRDPTVIKKELEGLRETELDLPEALREPTRDLLAGGGAWLEQERADRRGRLAKELKAAAAEQGVALTVVTREPLVLHLAPLSLAVDLEQGRVSLQFGRQELLQCPTDAQEIVAARETALRQLERKGWTPEGFHRELREAWKMVAARAGHGDDWVELAVVLPQLAFNIQSPRWQRDPKSRYFTDYGKARMLFELCRLRDEGALSQEGWRLVLGPATGGSTRDKNRVFWVDDGSGYGAYHLTLRFVRDKQDHESSR